MKNDKLKNLEKQVQLCKLLSRDLTEKTETVCEIISKSDRDFYFGWAYKTEGISQIQIKDDIIRLRRELNKLSRQISDF